MKKKAMSFSKLIALIIGAAVILTMIIIAISPQIKLFASIKTYGGKCRETGITMDEYQLEIENLIKDFDITAVDKEEDIVDLYKEFIDCFPDNNLEAYMEGLSENEVFNFIFVMKEQRYYDKTTLKIAERYIKRFPSGRIAEVNSYVNDAKAAIG